MDGGDVDLGITTMPDRFSMPTHGCTVKRETIELIREAWTKHSVVLVDY